MLATTLWHSCHCVSLKDGEKSTVQVNQEIIPSLYCMLWLVKGRWSPDVQLKHLCKTECQGQHKECCPLQAQILQQPVRPALILPFGRADGRAIVMKGCCRHPPSVPRSRLVVHLKVYSHCSVAAAWPIPNLNTRKSSLIGLLLLSLFMNPPFVDTP